MSESTQHKLDRVRPPRVQITYDVEVGDAIAKKELPFIVGVLADLSGQPAQALPKVRDRKFVEIDRDNLNDVLASKIAQAAVLRVDWKRFGESVGSELQVVETLPMPGLWNGPAERVGDRLTGVAGGVCRR